MNFGYDPRPACLFEQPHLLLGRVKPQSLGGLGVLLRDRQDPGHLLPWLSQDPSWKATSFLEVPPPAQTDQTPALQCNLFRNHHSGSESQLEPDVPKVMGRL